MLQKQFCLFFNEVINVVSQFFITLVQSLQSFHLEMGRHLWPWYTNEGGMNSNPRVGKELTTIFHPTTNGTNDLIVTWGPKNFSEKRRELVLHKVYL